MKNTRIQKQGAVIEPRVRTYGEIGEYLDAAWKTNISSNRIQALKQLDAALSNVSQGVRSIVVTGTNGKSLTAHFTARLLMEEGFRVGVLYAPHILTYNERFSLNGEYINNKQFTDIANEVIPVAEAQGAAFHASELLFMMAFEFFKQNNVDVVIVETQMTGIYDPAMILHPRVVGVTRIINPNDVNVSEEMVTDMLAVVRQGTTVISADQNKQSLQKMQKLSNEKGAEWAMPIRKVASLPYPFEQLHGRCASLAERIASIFTNALAEGNKTQQKEADSLLVKKKGQRGRPTLEAKRNHELNPPKTVNEFWAKTVSELPVRFQLLDKEKPSTLLDNASNLDALENVLLGIRLLHYQKPFKGLSIILGFNDMAMINNEELLKMLRYFFKKTSGQVILCLTNPVAGQKKGMPLTVEKIANDLKSMKIKAMAVDSFEEAFAAAKEMVDERNGLVVITGSNAIISEYWKFKGMKRI